MKRSTAATARPFVGREDVMAQLEADLVCALDGSGRAVILHGSAGCGRSSLVEHFATHARQRHRRLRSAIGDAADPEHPAWAQLAFSFTAGQRAGGVVRRSIRDWIGVTPVVGPVLAAAAETFRQLRPGAVTRHPVLGTGSSIDQVRLLLSFGAGDPRLIILENLDASDRAELAGAFALVQRLSETRTLFIATCRSSHGRMPAAAAELGSEIERLKCGRVIQIPALTTAEVLDAVQRATRTSLPPEWEEWFLQQDAMTPGQLWQTFDRLMECDALRHSRSAWQWGTPPRQHSPDALSSDELAPFAPPERTLLAAAGRLGAEFDATALARTLGWPDSTVDDALALLVRRGVLALVETQVQGDDIIDRYAFRPSSDAGRWALVPQIDPDLIATPPADA